MDLEYFKEKIPEELAGALDYAKKSLEIRPMSPQWSKTLMDMSKMEVGHATNLYKMFEEYYRIIQSNYGADKVPKMFKEIYSEVTDKYLDCSAKVSYVQNMAVSS